MNLEREREPMQADGTRETLGERAPKHRARGVAVHRILVVDDFLDLANTMRLLLAHHGHVVMMACDARSTLKVIETFRPDVVLLDVGMQDEGGQALIQELRQDPNARRARLVATSGWGRDADVAGAHEHGVTDLLLESVVLGALLELIAITPRHDDVVEA